MSAAAITTAAPPAPGATGAAGSATGAAGGATHAAQASGLPAIFEAMLATLAQAEDAATGGAATAQANGSVKLAAGAGKTATPDDGKTAKTKADDATDGQAAATTTATTTPDATLALLVPAVTAAPAQATPQAGKDGDEVEAEITNASGKAQSVTLIPSRMQTAETAAEAAKAKAAAALAADGAAVNANATVKTDASAGQSQAQVQSQSQAQTQTGPQIPAPTDPTAQAAQSTPANLAAAAAATLTANAKTAPTATPSDGKTTVAKTDRAEAPNAAGPADVGALSANTAGKAADALTPVAGGAGKAVADKDGQAPADAEAPASDQPAIAQAPGDPAAATTATPATLAGAAAVAVRGSPQTVANLAAQIVKKLDARSTQFDVQLDPAGLGKVDVRLQIGADGKMSAAMSFDTPQAAAELRARSHELQQVLAQSGFDVSGGMSFDVSTDRGQNGQAQNQQPESGAAFRGRAFQAALDTTADAPPVSQLSLRRTSASGVDIRI